VPDLACPHCGLRSLEAHLAAREEARTRRFVQTLFTRPNPFTFVFIAINGLIFVLMWLAGGISLAWADPVVLKAFGAKVNVLIDQGQYWRLVTCIFIHIGIGHLVLNNYALWIMGQQIEQIYGSSRFVILYLVSGLAGSAASYHFSAGAISAGASGAIFGLFGAMGTFAFRYKGEVPELLRRHIIRRVVPIIAINLAFGLSVEIVDNAAHVGGLLGGVVIALLVPYKRPHERITALVWRALMVICAALIGLSFAGALSRYDGPRLDLRNLLASADSRLDESNRRVEQAARLLVESLNGFNRVLAARSAAPDTVGALDAARQGLDAIAAYGQGSGPELRVQHLLEVLTEQKEIIGRFDRSEPKDWVTAAKEEQALIEKAKAYSLVTEGE
jgi:rhomboid protease GluP